MKKIRFLSLLVLFLFTLLLGSNVSHAQTTLPDKPLPCYTDEIEPNDTIDISTPVCSNDVGTIYGELNSKDVDYFRESNYFDYSDFTIEIYNPGNVRLELLEDSGKAVSAKVTSNYSYDTYYYHRLQKGTYYIKVYWGNESTSNESIKYLLRINQKVFFTGWSLSLDRTHWEYWQENRKYEGTGWIYYKNQWFYVKNGARQQYGWIAIDTKYYYLTPDNGVMKSGWLLDKGKWYYLDKTSGAMKTGWLLDGGKWYFLNKGGSMATDWVKVSNKWYYLYSDGHMAANTKIGSYKLGKDGAWIK